MDQPSAAAEEAGGEAGSAGSDGESGWVYVVAAVF